MDSMKFQRKSFLDAKAIIISEKPLAASILEERISALIPSMESRIDSFETYLDAYEHCSNERIVGMVYFHYTENNCLPINFVDELARPFEAIGSTAGVFIIAQNEKAFTEAYKMFGNSPRLLGIVLENDLMFEAVFKEQILASWQKFEVMQKKTALPSDEIDYILRLTAKFENTETLARLTNIISAKLDRNWYDELVIEAAPAILCLPAQQRWILNNSPSLLKISKELEQYRGKSINELITAKDGEIVARAVFAAHRIYEFSKETEFELKLDAIAKGSNSFSPTLLRIIAKEKANILDLFNSNSSRASA